MSVEITIDTSDYDQKLILVREAISEFGRQLIQEATPTIQQELANQVPVKTGALRSSISSIIDENESWTGTHTGYGLYVDQPTQPHVIRAKIGEFLRFKIDGQWIRKREVQHPGTQGNFFIDRTVNIVMGQIIDKARNIWSSLTNR